jgi:hypothetical protein
MPVTSPPSAHKTLFYDGVDARKHRIFLYLSFSEEHRDFRVLRADRLGDELVETETDVPRFIDTATSEERRAFSDLVSTVTSL